MEEHADKQAQTKGWNEFTDSTDSFDKMNVLRKIFEGKSSEKLGTLEKPDGTLTDPGEDTLNLLIQTHFPDATGTTPTTNNQEAIPLKTILENETEWISISLLSKVFNNLNPKNPQAQIF